MSESNTVTCKSCAHFVPDAIGSGQGIGRCGVLEAYRLALKAKGYSGQEYNQRNDRAERKLGILTPIAKDGARLLYPAIERQCRKHLVKHLEKNNEK